MAERTDQRTGGVRRKVTPDAHRTVDEITDADVVVVGAGVAGLSVALGAPGRVTVLTKGMLGRSGSTAVAQGGIAAAVGPDDSPALHAADTLAAADGLADPTIVRLLTSDGPARLAELIARGARLDRTADGTLARGKEAAHSRARVLHAGGDATGAEVGRALAAAVRAAPQVRVCEAVFAEYLATADGRVVGVVVRHTNGRRVLHRAPAVVLATGGIGQVYRYTTNPAEVTGDGQAMAARAGAALVDMELVQFHPTALAVPSASDGTPLPLLTEALRGEGAQLVDRRGRRFMPDAHPAAELAPRDVVARAIWRRRAAGDETFLDARGTIGDRLPDRFPTVFAACMRHGIDPRRQPMPVTPAAHYHMGGVAVDSDGRSTLSGLWACGEVASTGAHGANRLASNSLLEGLVFGARVAADIAAADPSPPPAVQPAPPRRPAEQHTPSAPAEDTRDAAAAQRTVRAAVRTLAWQHVGLLRDGDGLRAARDTLERLADRYPGIDGEARSTLDVARLVTAAALARTESRGAHFRTDMPTTDPSWTRRLYVGLAEAGRPRVLGSEPVGAAQPAPAEAVA